MERGKLDFGSKPTTVFVFDGLIGLLHHPKLEKIALATHRWRLAIDAWNFQYRVCDYINRLASYGVPIEVITWRPQEFAEEINSKLWSMDTAVQHVRSAVYEEANWQISVDINVNLVYDPDPAHRHSYGYKGRQFELERM
jgi:hypothetical protein